MFFNRKNFGVSQQQFKIITPHEMKIEDLQKLEVHSLVSVEAKVIRCERPTNIGCKRKQNVLIGDATGACTLQLWEENIGMLEKGNSYGFN